MPKERAKSSPYAVIKYLILLAVACVLLWFSFKGIKWSDFKEGLIRADFKWIAASMLIGVLAFLFRSLRWRLLMLPLSGRVKRIDAWDGVNIGYITNFVIPRAGEFARCGVITGKRGLPYESVVGTVVLERMIDLLALVMVTFTVILIRWEKFGGFIYREIFEVIEKRFSLNIFWVVAVLTLSLLIFAYIIYRYRETHPFLRKVVEITKGIIHGVVSGFKMPQKWLFLLYTVLIWVCYWQMSYATILAFPSVTGLSLADALFLSIVGGLGWVIPVQGGIGAYHFIVSLALTSIYGIGRTEGVVFATISHESQVLTMLIFGAISLINFSFFNKKKR